MRPGAWPEAAAIREAVQADAAPTAGLHNLVAQAPWPPQGSCVAVNGRLVGLWSCTVCGKRASDSSRAAELARKPCQAAGWLGELGPHDLQEQAAGFTCSRCGLQTTAQHVGQAGRSRCPVPSCSRDGQAWPEGEAGLRALLGRIRGHRRWCEVPAAAEAAAAAEEVIQAADLEETPAAGMPPAHLQSLGDPSGQAAVPAEPAVKEPRLADGVARLWAAAAVVPGPLAAAAGPEERRRLKRAADRQGEGAAHAAEPTEASSHCGKNRTLPIDLAGDWPLGGPKCPLGGPKCEGRAAGSSVVAGAVPLLAWESVQLVPVQPVLVQPVQLEPGPGPAAQPLSRAKRARFIPEAQSGPPALCWQPYVGHMALRLGRSGLWCMRCFTQPIGDYRVWLRGRCSDERPPSVAPSSLSAALLRAGDLDANASEALRSRFAALLASARVVPIPVVAFRAGSQAGGRQVQEQGRGSSGGVG